MHTLNDVVDSLESVIDYEADKKAKDYFIDYMVGRDWAKDDINKSMTRLSELMDDTSRGDIELAIFYMFIALVEAGKVKFDMTIKDESDEHDGEYRDVAKDAICDMSENKTSMVLNTDGGHILIDLIKHWEFK